MVLFPHPDGPTSAVTFPAGKQRFTLLRTLTPGRLGYEKLTSLKEMSSWADASGSFKPPSLIDGASITWKKAVDALMALDMTINGPAKKENAVPAARTEKMTLIHSGISIIMGENISASRTYTMTWPISPMVPSAYNFMPNQNIKAKLE